MSTSVLLTHFVIEIHSVQIFLPLTICKETKLISRITSSQHHISLNNIASHAVMVTSYRSNCPRNTINESSECWRFFFQCYESGKITPHNTQNWIILCWKIANFKSNLFAWKKFVFLFIIRMGILCTSNVSDYHNQLTGKKILRPQKWDSTSSKTSFFPCCETSFRSQNSNF